MGEQSAASVPGLEEVNTEEIESEEVDIFERKNKFDEVLRRMEHHRKQNAHLRGNDLRYNVYMRKLNKLTRKDLGLDLEAYKDYVNNLKQFAHVNNDFEIFARDNLASNNPEMRELIQINFKQGGGLQSQEDIARFNLKCEQIFNTLRKLRRDASGFLTAHDKSNIKDYVTNMRDYVRHVDLYEQTKGLYDKRQQELKDRKLTNNGIIDVTKVTDKHLEAAGVSRREFEHIKILLALDAELFSPSEYGSFSPHSMLIDVSKYADQNLSKDVKEILYRPPKVKNLYEKYWQLAKILDNRERQEHDAEILTDHKPRYPRKSQEEVLLIDSILSKIEQLVEEDKRDIERRIGVAPSS